MTDQGCTLFTEHGVELALGVLPAEDRAALLAHLDRCPRCRADLREFTAISDELLGLVPSAEPPAGFETATVRRLLESGPQRGGRTRRAPGRWRTAQAPARRGFTRGPWISAAVAAGIAVLAGLGGLAVGTALNRPQPPPPVTVPAASPELRSAPLTANGREVGEMYVYTGSPSWVYMALRSGTSSGQASCELLRRDGNTVPIGSFPLHAGAGYWGAPSPVDPAALIGTRIVGPDGAPLATAHFG